MKPYEELTHLGRLRRRCGFVQEGRLRASRRNPEEAFSGDVLYGLSRSEYERLMESQALKEAKRCN
jgi:hypothetical protein